MVMQKNNSDKRNKKIILMKEIEKGNEWRNGMEWNGTEWNGIGMKWNEKKRKWNENENEIKWKWKWKMKRNEMK
jgi:hypothetical protein